MRLYAESEELLYKMCNDKNDPIRKGSINKDFNSKKNTIEFRMANGTLSPEVIKQNVFLYASLINTAIQMTENPQEFQEKLEAFYRIDNNIDKQFLLPETEDILALIYRSYWATDQENIKFFYK